MSSPDQVDRARPVVLWAVPRSRSTAFERIFVERDDFEVVHEPFSATYYHSPERRSDAFLDGEPDPGAGSAEMLADVVRPRDRRVFVKDMAYHVTAFMDDVVAQPLTHTFLVRDPRQTLPSLHRKHPGFTFEETGFEQLARLYDLVRDRGVAPHVVDADDLMRDPEAVVRDYCAAIDAPFDPAALSWEAETVPQFDAWHSWHENAQRSTGLGEVDGEPAPLPDEVRDVYHRCLPFYERLLAARASPRTASG